MILRRVPLGMRVTSQNQGVAMETSQAVEGLRHEHHTDHAVLFGTVLTTGFIIEDTSGAWDRIDTLLGVVLLLILVGYFRSITEDGSLLERLARLGAFWASTGLALMLAVGWPAQHFLKGQYVSRGCVDDCLATKIDNNYLFFWWLVFVGVTWAVSGARITWHHHAGRSGLKPDGMDAASNQASPPSIPDAASPLASELGPQSSGDN